jgi:hypothetical protein
MRFIRFFLKEKVLESGVPVRRKQQKARQKGPRSWPF